MADRYWVGGTDSWNGTALLKWSTTSGGVGGAAEPTAADDVFFDSNSGTGTVTVVTTTGKCRSLNFTGFTGTFNNVRQVDIGDATAGNIVLGSGMTYAGTNGSIQFVSTASGNLITSNGITWGSNLKFGSDSGAGGTWQFQDAVTVTESPVVRQIQMFGGLLNTNGQSVTCYNFNSTDGAGGTPILTLGASTFTVTGDTVGVPNGIVWDISAPAGVTINPDTSTIVISSVSANQKRFDGGSKTYNNLSITGGGTGIVLFGADPSGFTNNTFANLPQITGGTKSIRFTAGTTQTFTGGTNFGNGANLITIDTQIAGSSATLSKASGTVEVTSISLKDSTAAGGATWNAFTSDGNVNVSGNTGWNFVEPVLGGAGVQQNALLLGVG